MDIFKWYSEFRNSVNFVLVPHHAIVPNVDPRFNNFESCNVTNLLSCIFLL